MEGVRVRWYGWVEEGLRWLGFGGVGGGGLVDEVELDC